jgi:hypothetical protein
LTYEYRYCSPNCIDAVPSVRFPDTFAPPRRSFEYTVKRSYETYTKRIGHLAAVPPPPCSVPELLLRLEAQYWIGIADFLYVVSVTLPSSTYELMLCRMAPRLGKLARKALPQWRCSVVRPYAPLHPYAHTHTHTSERERAPTRTNAHQRAPTRTNARKRAHTTTGALPPHLRYRQHNVNILTVLPPDGDILEALEIMQPSFERLMEG